MRRLAAQVKLDAVLEVVRDRKTLLEVSSKFGCSRQSLAAWVRRYGTNATNGTNKSSFLAESYRRGSSHPKSISPRLEKRILDLVVKHPEFNVHKLARVLTDEGAKISSFGVYKVLVRHNLQVRELRQSFSFSHPAGTVYATHITPAYRKKFMEEYLFGHFSISQICRRWSVSRRTFYKWLRRYKEVAGTIDNLPFDAQGKQLTTDQESQMSNVKGQMSVIEALAKRYKRGVDHHNSIGQEAREAVLSIVRSNPYFSVHRIYSELAREGKPFRVNLQGKPISHAAIQNLLFRENLNTVDRRLEFAQGYILEPLATVAPQYVPEIPVYKWRQLFAPFVTIPKLLISDPLQGLRLLGLASLPVFALVIFARSVFGAAPGTSPIGLIIASVALFFGLFFFIYSLKYYISIFMVLKLAQSGTSQTGGVSA